MTEGLPNLMNPVQNFRLVERPIFLIINIAVMKNSMNMLLVLLILGLVACAKEELPTPAGDDSAITFRGQDVPLKGKMSFTSVSRSFDGPTVIERWEGSGQFTHMGRTTVVVHQSITAGELSGNIKLTAANGDQMTWEYTGGLTSFDPVTLAFTSAIGFTISSGTGRFIEAGGSGSGTGSGVFPNFPPGPNDAVTVDVIIKGRINY